MQVTNLAPKLAMCLQKQLVCLYMCWIAATGLALMFVILPGYQTLIKFQQTECTTVKVHKSGSNPCAYCLQVSVVTKEKSSVTRPLQQDELGNARVRFIRDFERQKCFYNLVLDSENSIRQHFDRHTLWK